MFYKPFSCFLQVLLFSGVLLLVQAGIAHADETKKTGIVDIIPAHSGTGEDTKNAPFTDGAATHPALKLTPDRSELIRLDKNAASIILGNPLHVTIMAESERLLVVVPKAAGATYMIVLDKKGEIIMQRHIIVAGAKENYLRIKRTCNQDSGDGCKNDSVFYCPDACHEIASETDKKDGKAAGASAKGDKDDKEEEKSDKEKSDGDSENDEATDETTTEE